MIIKKIKNEYKRFIWKEFKNLFGNWNKDHLISDYSDQWKYYYFKNIDKINSLFEKLYKNIDNESIEAANLIFNRNVFLLPWRKIEDCYLYNLDKIYTDFEKQSQNYKIDYEKYKLPSKTDYLKGIFNFKNGLIFIDDIAKNHIKGKDVIDCGAYVGDSALVFSEYEPKNIYCFEPCKKNIELIKETIKLNQIDNVIKIIPLGVAKEPGKLNFSGDSLGYGVDESNILVNNTEENNVTSIDIFVKENNLDPGLIKMDIEGLEYNAITGSLETIKKFEPILIISIYHTPVDFFEIKPILEEIVDYNFLIRKIESDFLWTDLVLIGYPKKK